MNFNKSIYTSITMDILNDEEEEEEIDIGDKKPRPDDFDAFLPWACSDLNLNVVVIIESITLEKPKAFHLKSAKSKLKTKGSFIAHDLLGVPQSDNDTTSLANNMNPLFPIVKVTATHDPNGNLIMLKFIKNHIIPCQVFKVIEIILPYHKMLTNIVINQGLDHQGLHQLIVIVNFGCVTDLCLDNTAIVDGWYDKILEKKNKLRNLSLARCKIEDKTVKKIAAFLVHSSPASYTLQTLNLASNFVTDVGASELGISLRSNRRLVYLNLCDNRISDAGFIQILDALVPFIITNEEKMSYGNRKIEFIKKREYLIQNIIPELKTVDSSKKVPKKSKTPIGKKTKDERENSLSDIDAICYEKAKAMAEESMGEFLEPFSCDNRFNEDDLSYSYGNNILAYINLSYNHISYVSVKKILQVLLKQQELKRQPVGLVNIVIEGNRLPQSCTELNRIDAILLSKITSNPRKMSLAPKLKKINTN